MRDRDAGSTGGPGDGLGACGLDPAPTSVTEELAASAEPYEPPLRDGLRRYKEKLAALADKATEAQKPIRILHALQWPTSVWEDFRAGGYRELPTLTAESYARVDLGFDPIARARDFRDLAEQVARTLGDDALGGILRATCMEYAEVCEMLVARGTPGFYGYARRLYGSPKDRLPDGVTTVRDIAHTQHALLARIHEARLGPSSQPVLDGAQVVELLRTRFATYFGEDSVHVMADDGIIADAAAGSDYVKVRGGAKLSRADVDILEAHEGWVHVATSLNGAAQPFARWLGKGPPRTTSVQEGLAVLMELLTLRSHPRRARRLNERVLAVDMAEDGASFLDVFDWYRTEGYDEETCFNAARRVFRGGTLTGGAPFTKDIAYTVGLVTNYHFIRSAIRASRPEMVRYLFVGKVAHEDIPALCARVADGIVSTPRHLPPQFVDLNGLALWMAYATYFSQMGLDAMDDAYEQLFQRG